MGAGSQPKKYVAERKQEKTTRKGDKKRRKEKGYKGKRKERMRSKVKNNE